MLNSIFMLLPAFLFILHTMKPILTFGYHFCSQTDNLHYYLLCSAPLNCCLPLLLTDRCTMVGLALTDTVDLIGEERMSEENEFSWFSQQHHQQLRVHPLCTLKILSNFSFSTLHKSNINCKRNNPSPNELNEVFKNMHY